MTAKKVHGLLVAVDGSDTSLCGVDWAAAEAASQQQELSLCYVVDTRPMVDLPMPTELLTELRKRARHVLDRAMVRVRQTHPGLTVHRIVLHGEPARELTTISDEAELTVLGSRGTGRFTALLVGSVCAQVTAHATSPVVVVHAAGRPDGPVLVGVDGSARSERAVGWAFDHAHRHGRSLQALHVFDDPMAVPSLGIPRNVDHGQARESAERYLADLVAPWAEKYPEVAIEHALCGGSAARSLVDASQGASLVVVGRRGHGGFAGVLLGSVSQAVMRHAHCPVAVIR